jgi:protoporphyrinogen oxidase
MRCAPCSAARSTAGSSHRLEPLRAEADFRNSSVGYAVLGAGPAGLTAAHILALRGQPGTVFESDGIVGGLAKTVECNGYRFDLGGHRFFTKLAPIQRLWETTLGEEFLIRPRLSRIYYEGKYFSYPLRAADVVARLGILESALCAASYVWNRARRSRESKTFEDWVTTRFGRRLYDAFFRSYTEKVWGISGSEIEAAWAAQRIKDFSLAKAILKMAGFQRETATLIERFHYPRLGPGQMWEAFADRVEQEGISVELNSRCIAIRHGGNRAHSVVIAAPDGAEHEHDVSGVLSSIPLKDLVLALEPAAPPAVTAAAGRLRYRELCLVALMVDQVEPFPDNWIYLHDPKTRAGRVQNFGAWSPSMVAPGTTCLGVEYFCFEGDDIWEMSDSDAVAMASQELERIGLLDSSRVFDGVKVRVPRAYPMYDSYYRDAVEIIRPYISGFENIATFGRNGLHRYNNQDHSMWTAILATLNVIDGADYDVWSVNTEAEYLEEGDAVEGILDLDVSFRTAPLPERVPGR